VPRHWEFTEVVSPLLIGTGVAARALQMDISWLSELHSAQHTSPACASGVKAAERSAAQLDSFWRQHKPNLREDRAPPTYVLRSGQGANPPGRRRPTRAARDVRWAKVGTLARNHQVTAERVLVARTVDDLRRRSALGFRSPSRCERTGATRWRATIPPVANQVAASASDLVPEPEQQVHHRRRSGSKFRSGVVGSGRCDLSLLDLVDSLARPVP
jgi:hypothetical protein